MYRWTKAGRARPASAIPRLATRLLLVSALAVASVGVHAVGGAATPASAARAYGNEPIDDVLFWAGQYASGGPLSTCSGLSLARLSAMMIVPTYTETGSSGSLVPAPMTLSRWDTQSALWAFGDKSTPYQGAFWHPGVGMWQFDSAGGWPLTAAGAISSWSSAEQAAKVMGTRFCASSSSDVTAKMRYAWGPWRYCAVPEAGAPDCMAVFNDVYDGTTMSVVRNATVSRLGGMQARTCQVAGIGTIACYRVDPALAQGNRNWTSVSPAIPTPLTKPFYVFEANGREYRYWLAADSGYGVTVAASKPITANARTSLQWSFPDASSPLCDATANIGSCAWSGFTGTGIDGTQMSVTMNRDGRLEALVVAPDGRVLDLWQFAPNSGFVGGVVLPGVSGVIEIASARNRAGFIEVFALDGRGTVWGVAQTAAGWSPWVDLGGGITDSLSVGANQDGRLELFARNTWGSVTHKWQTGAGPWSGWTAMGSGPVSTVAVGTNADARLEVFAVTSDSRIVHAWQVAPNSFYNESFPSMGTGFAGRLTAARNADGRLEVMGRGTDGSLWGVWQWSANANWGGPGRYAVGSLAGDPRLIANRVGKLEIFTAGTGQKLVSMWQLAAGGPWSPWATMSSPPISSVSTATAQANGHLVVFARLQGGGLVWSVQQI